MRKRTSIMLTLIMVFTLAACSLGQTITDTTGIGSSSTTSGTAAPTAAASVADALAENSKVDYTAVEQNWDDSAIVPIQLNGDSITAEGSGLSVDGSTVTITYPGTYSLSGSLNDGQIIVNTVSEEVVRLIFNGVDLHSSRSAPIYIMAGKDVAIVLADNTINVVSDGSSYVLADPASDEPNAAIFSKADLTISGNGSLTVTGSYKDGINSKDGLLITGGTLNITAVDDGLRGKDYLVVKDGSITIDAQGDGLKSDNEEDTTWGYIAIEGGVFSITAGGDAINAQTDVAISGGEFTITTGGGAGRSTGDVSAKGIKGAVSVTIDGGTFDINAADDAVHSNSSIMINNGVFNIATGDDGMHADATLVVNNGEINITRSYEGLESAVITINGGTIHVVSSDDGLNVAAGNDGSGQMPGGRPGRGPGQDTFNYTGSNYLYIHGGYITVDANGDGIDINGAVEMTGGTLLVVGPTEQMNGPLDYDAGFNMTGGFLVAAGSSGMAMAPSTSSSQNSVLAYFNTVQAGTLIHIQTSDGEELLTFAPTKQYQSLAFSSPELTKGTYTIYLGGSSTGTVSDNLYQGGTYSGGTELDSFTISSAVTTVGSGGMGGPGTRPQRP